ncbi:NUDIX domain-containing protein [Kangiella sediminilitoris]|uniref:ADP-ribose pyrophosphatase n=1 Tax=Kangiella sediminilitoris TaxID=1144748 RepID=A0A1B3B945_9GAMM|nr:NUDIX domain-containing protein [Kangiella sediminilitoris]AOE49276.1 ADP-ribose pyrophosphatase [Kangiella sediminilitoris]
MNRFTQDDVKFIESESLYQGFFSMKKYRYQHRRYQGDWSPVIEREIFERGEAVGVLLYDPGKNAFIMIEQCRPGALNRHGSPWLLEIVAGMVELGEKPEDVATREALEEAGCHVKRLIPIPGYWVSPGGTTEYVDLFLGLADSDEVAEYAGLETEHEDIKVLVLSRAELLKLLHQGHINNAMAIIALQWFLLNERELDLA